MDYREYMNAVEELLAQLSDEQKNQWIRQWARSVDQTERGAVLARLSELRETAAAPLTEEQRIQALTLVMKPNEIRKWLDSLAEDEELGLKKYFSADEDYYESSLPSEIVLDPYELMGTMKKAFRACCQMVDGKAYRTAAELLRQLYDLRIPLHHMDVEFSEYDLPDVFDEEDTFEVGDELDIQELIRKGHLAIDENEFARCLLYACYQSETGADRLDLMFELFQGKLCGGMKMEDILSYGPEELLQLPRFMMNWKTYLTYKEGDKAAELLEEVCAYRSAGDERG